MGRLEGLDDLHEARPTRTREHEPDANRALEVPRHSPLERLRETRHSGADLGSEARARRRQRDPTAGAMHELLAELALEAPETLAHPRLREAEPFRGAAEVELFGQREKDLDLA
jgi:hypothetical protein